MKRALPDDTDGWKQRIVLNVSGRQIETSLATLNKSSFFRGMFEDAVPEEVVFVDADPVAFELLLRFMRRGVVNLALPKGEPAVCCAVLVEADFFGVDELLNAVKAAAWENSQPPVWLDSKRAGWSLSTFDPVPSMPLPLMGDLIARKTQADMAALFDKECGSIGEAIDAGVLPERYWNRAERKVVSMVAAAHTTWAAIGFHSMLAREWTWTSSNPCGVCPCPLEPTDTTAQR